MLKLRSTLRTAALTMASAGALFAVAGCSSGPDVRAEYDRSVDFAQYRTFTFASPLGTDRDGNESLLSKYLKAATQRELEARGLRESGSSAQLLVNFNAAVDEKVMVTSQPAPPYAGRGYYGYRSGMYGAWPAYYDETTITPYREGTLNIDIADSARKQLVWEGLVQGVITEKARENLEAAVDKVVTAAFEKFPLARAAPKP